MDGWVKIGAELEDDKLDQDLKKMKSKLEAEEKQMDLLVAQEKKLNEELITEESKRNDLIRKIKETKAELDKITVKENKRAPEYLKMEKLQSIYDTTNSSLNKQEYLIANINSGLAKNEISQMKINTRTEEYKNKINEIEVQKQKKDFSKIGDAIKNVGNKVDSVVKKVGKWALAVFGIRTAYSLVQKAMSTLSQHDSQIKTDIEYIGYAMASMLKPVVEWLIQGVYTLLTYVNYLAKAWFGVNLFANATTKEFAKATKQAKELKKTTESFDEMNIQSDTSSGSSSSGVATPSFDLSAPEDVPIPSWLEWIKNNKDLVLDFFATLGVLIAGLKISHFLGKLTKIPTSLGLIGLAVVAVAGAALIVTKRFKQTMDATKKMQTSLDPGAWVNYKSKMEATAITTGLFLTAIGGPLIGALGYLATKLVLEKDAILSVKDAQESLIQARNDVIFATDNYADALKSAETAQKRLEDAEKKNKISGEQLSKAVNNGTLSYADMTEAQKEVYKAYLDNDTAQKNAEDATKALKKAKEEETGAFWANELALAAQEGDYESYKKKVVDAYKNGQLSAEEAQTAIEKAMSGMSDASQATFMEDLPSDLKDGMDPDKYQTTGQKLKNWFVSTFNNIGDEIKEIWKKVINFVEEKIGINLSDGFKEFFLSLINLFTSKVNPIIAKPFDKINNLLNKIKNLEFLGITPFKKLWGENPLPVPQLPRLKTGGIINYPNQGVPVGGGRAIGGESGAEGVIPLTDSQAMETLGNAIGKYITIIATIENKMDSRVIGRQVQKVQADKDFVMNR